MLKLESWCTDKPIPIRIFAILLSISATTCFEILTDVRNNRLREPFEIPDVTKWFKFYHSHRNLQQYLITAFSKFDGFTPIFANLFKNFTQKDQAQAVEENTVQAEVISLEKIFEALIFYIKNDIEHTPLNDKVRDNVLEDIVTPEFLFLMKVDFPCQFFYHERPSRIFKEACLGDKESLKKLLLLDKVIIRHPMISKWLHLYSYNENKSVIEDLSAAIVLLQLEMENPFA